jgi:hypothetical protein
VQCTISLNTHSILCDVDKFEVATDVTGYKVTRALFICPIQCQGCQHEPILVFNIFHFQVVGRVDPVLVTGVNFCTKLCRLDLILVLSLRYICSFILRPPHLASTRYILSGELQGHRRALQLIRALECGTSGPGTTLVIIPWDETPQAPSSQIPRKDHLLLLDLRNLQFLKPGRSGRKVTFLYELRGVSDEMVRRPQVEGQPGEARRGGNVSDE